MTSATADALREAAAKRNRQILEEARAAGLLGASKDIRISGRITASLLAAAKERAHVTADTELIEIALARLALEDDFGAKLVRRKGSLPKNVDLGF
jgi:hypothetical protein